MQKYRGQEGFRVLGENTCKVLGMICRRLLVTGSVYGSLFRQDVFLQEDLVVAEFLEQK